MIRDFSVIIDILKQECNIESNEKLAKLLDIGWQNLRKRKMENNIPYPQLFNFCHDRGLNIHNIITTDGLQEYNKKITDTRLEKKAIKLESDYLSGMKNNMINIGKKSIHKSLKDVSFEIEFYINQKIKEGISNNNKEINKKFLERRLK